MDPQVERIAKVSARLRLVSTLLMFAIPVVLALVWAFMENLPFNTRLPVKVDASLPLISRILAFLASMIPGGVAIYALSRLRRLFDLYAHGVIFREANVECFRQLGWSLFAWAGASFLFNTLAGFILTFHWKPGTRLLVLSLDSQDIMAVFSGLVVITVAWVMDQGRKLNEEQQLFV
ncbi:MAG: DUF2975 domain-containing protein [Desulfarculus sp.]|nr:DUF2975 domain-containing protein [Pseudomonadota bacterium]MBU4574973.1 DUF2975 domain-containing protein [Pseudomonadota bacterium]MBU4597341.1 DUF2975 domain-containing protein [Pseudomonadota bacterium]MBV1715804.1 DUF2975 domain-containing protein [Desulfarculus sp.]MBV1739159.1 DUF2975 domain-containing protein [Desulfarculus sp.]